MRTGPPQVLQYGSSTVPGVSAPFSSRLPQCGQQTHASGVGGGVAGI